MNNFNIVFSIPQLFQCKTDYSCNSIIREKIDRNDHITAQGILAAVQSGAGCLGTLIAVIVLNVADVSKLFIVISVIAVFGVILLYGGYGILNSKKSHVNEVRTI